LIDKEALAHLNQKATDRWLFVIGSDHLRAIMARRKRGRHKSVWNPITNAKTPPFRVGFLS